MWNNYFSVDHDKSAKKSSRSTYYRKIVKMNLIVNFKKSLILASSVFATIPAESNFDIDIPAHNYMFAFSAEIVRKTSEQSIE